jgi:tmRNA-binding protein
VQLREEMHDEFSAVRDEMRGGDSAVREEMQTGDWGIREEMQAGFGALREEMRSGDSAVREEMQGGFAALREEMHALHGEAIQVVEVLNAETNRQIAETRRHMLVLHEEVIDRLQRLDAGWRSRE